MGAGEEEPAKGTNKRNVQGEAEKEERERQARNRDLGIKAGDGGKVE